MDHVFLFDGTGNGLDDIYPTNIRILRGTLPGSHYYEGPGNGDGLVDKLLGGGVGAGVLGAVDDAYTALKAVYQPGDRIFAFGFSRGAGETRLFTSKVCTEGVNNHDPGIQFMGCFDTVIARAPFGWLQQNTFFGDLHVNEKVLHVAHALALDEDREAFTPKLMNAREGVNEVWFKGCHSDIGGGYEERGLANITLHWMVEQAMAAGLNIDISKLPLFGSSPETMHREEGLWPREPRRVGIKRDDEWSKEPALIWDTDEGRAI